MKITGHKTDSVFRRYLIVDEELLAQATGAVSEMLGEQDTQAAVSRPLLLVPTFRSTDPSKP
jgi:hypothetical protein